MEACMWRPFPPAAPGAFILTEYVPTDERTGPRFPLLLTTGRVLTQYNVGAQTRRTENVVWHPEDRLEIHPHDAEHRGIGDGAWVKLASREGETSLRALITARVSPGVVYTTFHHPGTQANVVTTELSDWATNCPEYKVTAVQVTLSNGPTEWQTSADAQNRRARPDRADPRGVAAVDARRLTAMAKQIGAFFRAQGRGGRRGRSRGSSAPLLGPAHAPRDRRPSERGGGGSRPERAGSCGAIDPWPAWAYLTNEIVTSRVEL